MIGTTLNRMIFWELVRVFLLSLGTLTGLFLIVGLVHQASQLGLTLAQLVRQGYRVGIVDLTDGEPTPCSPGPEVRLEEARRAAEVLGVHVRVNLDLPNRRLFDSFETRVALAKELRKYRPKLVLGFGEKTPLASPDHWQAMQITDAAVFYSRLTKWDEHFDGLPVHTVSAQLYYTLAFASLGLPPAAGHLVVSPRPVAAQFLPADGGGVRAPPSRAGPAAVLTPPLPGRQDSPPPAVHLPARPPRQMATGSASITCTFQPWGFPRWPSDTGCPRPRTRHRSWRAVAPA